MSEKKKIKFKQILTFNCISPVWNRDWNKRANFSSMTLSVPFFSARLIFFNCMLRKLHEKCRFCCWSSKLPVLFRISPEVSDNGAAWFCCWACACDSVTKTTTETCVKQMSTTSQSSRLSHENYLTKWTRTQMDYSNGCRYWSTAIGWWRRIWCGSSWPAAVVSQR